MEIDSKLNSSIVAYSYSVVLGASYIFAFWRPIGFNIFPYLSLKDFLTTLLTGLLWLFSHHL